MSDSAVGHPHDELAPVAAGGARRRRWTARLVHFLRLMAVILMAAGLYHWAMVCGFGLAPGDRFDARTLPWQSATAFFAVIDLVAAVGLWLAAPWGAVVWLTASISMIIVHLFFPQVYGFHLSVVGGEAVGIAAYLVLAILAAREQPQ